MPKQTSLFSDSHYADFLNGLKQRIRSAQVKAALAVNRELIHLYWQIGHEVLTRQQEQGWGGKVIERLAKDLKREFPDIAGFSQTNLKYMRTFAESYSEEEISQRCVDQLPWRHNIVLFTKLKESETRFWYAQKALEYGWSRDILVMQIESNLFDRLGGAITNFERSLPTPQSDLAQQLIKDPYNFDFLTLTEEAQERELERALIQHIREFLMELGLGFAFLGSQYPLIVSNKEYRLDLLFYHVHLHCYVVIDLKMGEFEPQHSGQMSFYVAAVDNLLRGDRDDPTIGIILCKSQDKTIVEYALQGSQQPIGVSTYQLQSKLPPNFQENLPTIEQLEMELSNAVEEIEDDRHLEYRVSASQKLLTAKVRVLAGVRQRCC
jgi:predicted nuclease of restriction endonuclease-like (RecB) superfamily